MSSATPTFCGPLGGFFVCAQAESWKPPDQAPIQCRDVEQAVELGLGLYRLIRDANERWAQAVRAGKAEFTWAAAEQFAAAYQWWLDGARPVLDAVGECARQRVDVQRAQEFRDAFREVSLLPLDLDRVRAAVAAVDRGETVTLEQALDELQDHLQG